MKRWKNNAYRDKAMKIWLQVYFPSRYLHLQNYEYFEFSFVLREIIYLLSC